MLSFWSIAKLTASRNSPAAPHVTARVFDDGTWAVVDAAGRFDTNDLEEIKGIHWVLPDDGLRTLPIEIFARQYYEPGLLRRFLAGEEFPPIPSIATLNPIQPKVRILDVVTDPGAPGRAKVRVEVAGAEGQVKRGGRYVTERTGAFDLRLFRDGQLVGYRDGQVVDAPPGAPVVVTFDGIRLPKGAKEVEFSAYAFNDDQVKSLTARKALEPPASAPVKGTAYVIAIGVNACENPDWNLRYSANDAASFQRVVGTALRATGAYGEVVSVSLVSDFDAAGRLKSNGATKANVKAVLDALAGKQAATASIPGAAQLRPARPEDLVLVAFSGHGYRADDGEFYLVPYDVGAGARLGSPEMLARCVSSQDLTTWLRDVDAGQMGMVIDACHSGAFAGEAFKPGPMGSRGLGQLAYDKGMRILAGTQSDNVAKGSGALEQGLVTYALTVEGVERGRADRLPNDGTLAMAEWLGYSVDRVPTLYNLVAEAARTGRLPDELRGLVQVRPVASATTPTTAVEVVQRPVLFDFVKKGRDAVIARRAAGGAR
jgi:uncharacterized caspase-like protein